VGLHEATDISDVVQNVFASPKRRKKEAEPLGGSSDGSAFGLGSKLKRS
jgi:hypothetical protein